MAEKLPRHFVKIMPSAREDIVKIHESFLTSVGIRVAEEWEENLYDALVRLADTPYREVDLVASRRFGAEIRKVLYRRVSGAVGYHIFFSVEADEQAPGGTGYVMVIAIRHASARLLPRAEAQRRMKEMKTDN
jgi:plasmid stabilization system protein ParE